MVERFDGKRWRQKMAGDSDKRFELDDLEYPDVDVVENAKDWKDLDRIGKKMEDLGVKKYLILKSDSAQYFGKDKEGKHWIDVTEAWNEHLRTQRKFKEEKMREEARIGPKVCPPRSDPPNEPYVSFDERFIKNRIAFQVAPYALADVLEALHRDDEHRVETVVTKEDGHLVVFFYREYKSVSNGMPEGEGTVYYPGAGKKVKVD